MTVFADNRHERDDRLEAAVASLRDIATELRVGILVTRESPQSFTVTVSPLVPFGMTREMDELGIERKVYLLSVGGENPDEPQ